MTNQSNVLTAHMLNASRDRMQQRMDLTRLPSSNVVGVIRHDKAGMTVEVRLTPDFKFSVDIAGHRIEDKDPDKVRETALAVMWEAVRLEWIPVIEMRNARDGRNGEYQAMLGYSMRRYHVAMNSANRWLAAGWDAKQNGAVDVTKAYTWEYKVSGTLSLPFSVAIFANQPSVFVQAYDANTWNALTDMQQALDVLHWQMMDAFAHLDDAQKINDLSSFAHSVLRTEPVRS